MSRDVREELAAAATTVDGITCSPYYRQTLKPGEAMVRYDRTDRQKFGGVVTWQIAILLPEDTADAERYLDKLVPDVADALEAGRHLTVTAIYPQQFVLPDQGIQPFALIEGTREE